MKRLDTPASHLPWLVMDDAAPDEALHLAHLTGEVRVYHEDADPKQGVLAGLFSSARLYVAAMQCRTLQLEDAPRIGGRVPVMDFSTLPDELDKAEGKKLKLWAFGWVSRRCPTLDFDSG